MLLSKFISIIQVEKICIETVIYKHTQEEINELKVCNFKQKMLNVEIVHKILMLKTAEMIVYP